MTFKTCQLKNIHIDRKHEIFSLYVYMYIYIYIYIKFCVYIFIYTFYFYDRVILFKL